VRRAVRMAVVLHDVLSVESHNAWLASETNADTQEVIAGASLDRGHDAAHHLERWSASKYYRYYSRSDSRSRIHSAHDYGRGMRLQVCCIQEGGGEYPFARRHKPLPAEIEYDVAAHGNYRSRHAAVLHSHGIAVPV
jgi:hypothetical protein